VGDDRALPRPRPRAVLPARGGPIFQAFHYSGYKWNGLSSPTNFVGLDNFKRAFQDDVFRGALKHNGDHHRALAGRAAALRAGIAWILNQRLRGRALLRVLFFAPFVLSRWSRRRVVADAPATGSPTMR
jgi:ABC-type sugar transport system permease subunit